MGRFKLWMVIGGAVLAFYGFKEWRLSGEVKSAPQTITCEALARDGYGDNAHVRLTEFLVSPASYVYEEGKGGWKKVWLPLVPLNGPYAEQLRALPEDAEIPAPRSFGVILQTDEVSNEDKLGALAERDVVEGVVINEIDSLDSETKKLLNQAYPGIDLEKCWILEHNRKTKGMASSLLFLLLGLGIAGAGLYLFVKGGRGKGPR